MQVSFRGINHYVVTHNDNTNNLYNVSYYCVVNHSILDYLFSVYDFCVNMLAVQFFCSLQVVQSDHFYVPF